MKVSMIAIAAAVACNLSTAMAAECSCIQWKDACATACPMGAVENDCWGSPPAVKCQCADAEKTVQKTPGTCTSVCEGGKCTDPTADIAPNCFDGIMNGDETLIDCGGTCVACPEGATCDDKKKNGNENGVDCGGNCPACETCNDNVKNQDETGVDCGGASCDACSDSHWRAGPWSACDEPCGGGKQTRVLECLDGANKVVDSKLCTDATHEGTTEQECNLDPCATYNWGTNDWDPCQTECGTGIQSRTVSCYSSKGDVVVPDTMCEGDGSGYVAGGVYPKPPLQQACTVGNATCAAAVHWEWGSWGECTATCADTRNPTGSQTRTVSCVDNDGAVGTGCNGPTEPDATRDCVADCSEWDWAPCDWAECTAECGGVGNLMLGVRERQIFCRNQFGDLGDTALCNGGSMPASVETGCNPEACTRANWMGSSWGPCLGGERRRSSHCHAADGSNTVTEDCPWEWQPVLKKKCDPVKCDAMLPDDGFWKPDFERVLPTEPVVFEQNSGTRAGPLFAVVLAVVAAWMAC